VLALRDGELVDREPVVVVRLIEVERARLRARNGTVCPAILHRHTIH
jgi:hypothetical protein